jgi:hypothetical protein
MQRVVNFYEKLPRGPAPEVKATGLLGRYQAKHFGKNPTAKRTSRSLNQAVLLRLQMFEMGNVLTRSL